MPRISIYLTEAMQSRMRSVPNVVWSAIANEAFDTYLSRYEEHANATTEEAALLVARFRMEDAAVVYNLLLSNDVECAERNTRKARDAYQRSLRLLASWRRLLAYSRPRDHFGFATAPLIVCEPYGA